MILSSCIKSTKPKDGSNGSIIRLDPPIIQTNLPSNTSQSSTTPSTNSSTSTTTNTPSHATSTLKDLFPTLLSTGILKIHELSTVSEQESCSQKYLAIQQFCDDISTGYLHPTLSFFNEFICQVHDKKLAQLEYILCTLRQSGDISFDPTKLPKTINNTLDGVDINITISTPTESFALSNKYLYKALISFNNTLTINMYWGLDISNIDTKKTKGFMIAAPLPNNFSLTAGQYLHWDLSTNAQTISFLSLQAPSNQFLLNPLLGDEISYLRLNYNNSNFQTYIQSVAITAEKQSTPIKDFGCFKIFALGEKNANMLISKTRDEYNHDVFYNKGHALNSTATSVNDMDGICGVDRPETISSAGILKNALDDYDNWEDNIENVMNVAKNSNVMDLSCFNLNFANFPGGVTAHFPFSSDYAHNLVDFQARPEDIFPTQLTPVVLPSNFCQRDSHCACK